MAERVDELPGPVPPERVVQWLELGRAFRQCPLPDRVGILDRGRLLFLEPVSDVKRRFGVETLEQAFFAATGRKFENEGQEEDDEYREVFA